MEISAMDDYFIEEIDSTAVPASELAQFEETQPIEVIDILAASDMEFSHLTENNSPKNINDDSELINESEEILIQKFITGEGDLPELYTKFEPDDEEEHDMPLTPIKSKITKNASESIDALTEETIEPTLPELSKQKMRGGTIRKRSVLNGALQGLMGEANLCYARGQVEVAEKICLEIVRQNPLASEPFFTLAEIYESRDKEKYMNFLIIAAHLNPHDRDHWIRIAEMHLAEGNNQRARLYYSKAIKVLPKDYDLRLRKGQLLELMGELSAAMFTYLKMIPNIPIEQAELCLTTAKKVAQYFHSQSKLHLALQAMGSAYEVCAHVFTPNDLNLYLELLISNKSYANVLKCLRERTNLELETEREDNLELVFFCVIPDDYIPDFRSKLCVSLIHLRAYHLLDYLIHNVHEYIPIAESHLNFYIDIAEAMMQESKYVEAIELLKPITDGKILDCPAFIWLRQAECLLNLKCNNEAIESYYRVVHLAPFCFEAKFMLSTLLKQQGRTLEAVKALEQDLHDDGKPFNTRMLYERCLMLKQIKQINKYLEVGYVLLSRQSVQLRTREEMIAVANGGSFYNAEGLKVILQMRNITEDTDKVLQDYNKPQLEDSDLPIQDEYKLFIDLIETAFDNEKFSFIQRVCIAMITTKRFMGFHIELERIIILACYFNDDCTIAFSYLRDLITKNVKSTIMWNFFSLLIQKGQDLRYHRYIRRLLVRQSYAQQMRLFLAHYHLYCSSYKYALNIYGPMLKETPNPFVALCVAVVFNQISMQKRTKRKTAAIAQAIAFTQKYYDLRMASSTQQEIFYNIGRIYHQAGLLHFALEYYQRGLTAKDELIREHEHILGLQQEIAYNMCLIYRANGNLQQARKYLYDLIVV